MANPKLRWRLEDDSAEITLLSFSGLIPGTPSSWQTVHLWNNYGDIDAETARNLRLRIWGRLPGDTQWLAEGLDLLDKRAFQFQVLGGINQTVVPGGLQPLGTGIYAPLADVANDSAISLRLRAAPPSNALTPAIEIAFEILDERATPLPDGPYEAAGAGIRLGIGDGEMLELAFGGTATANGPADDSINIDDIGFVGAGVPQIVLEHPITFDNLDGDAAALAVGEGYYALLTIGADGLGEVRGPKAALPLTSDALPEVPAGQRAFLRVLRGEDGEIDTADITPLLVPGFYAYRTSGLTLYVGPGKAIVGRFLNEHSFEEGITLDASETSIVFRMPDGSLEKTIDGSRPDARAMPIYEAETDGSSILSVVDLRQFQDQLAETIAFVFPSPAASDALYWRNPFSTAIYLRPIRGVRMALSEDTATLANAASAWICDLETLSAGGSWVTLFTSQGTDDRRPTIAFNAANQETDAAMPEVLKIEPGQLVRAVVDAIATGGAAPEALVLSLTFEVPR